MIEVDPYKVDENLLNEKIREEINKRIGETSSDPYSFKYAKIQYDMNHIHNTLKESYIKGRFDNVLKTWINPVNVLKIENIENSLTNDRYLKIYMTDGTVYTSKEKSVEEFMIRQTLLGNSVD